MVAGLLGVHDENMAMDVSGGMGAEAGSTGEATSGERDRPETPLADSLDKKEFLDDEAWRKFIWESLGDCDQGLIASALKIFGLSGITHPAQAARLSLESLEALSGYEELNSIQKGMMIVTLKKSWAAFPAVDRELLAEPLLSAAGESAHPDHTALADTATSGAWAKGAIASTASEEPPPPSLPADPPRAPDTADGPAEVLPPAISKEVRSYDSWAEDCWGPWRPLANRVAAPDAPWRDYAASERQRAPNGEAIPKSRRFGW